MKMLLWKGVQLIFFIISFPFLLIWEIGKIIKKMVEVSAKKKMEERKEWEEFRNTPSRKLLTKSRLTDFELSMLQALESHYIVDNSSNLETVVSRLDFLHDRLAHIECQSKLKSFYHIYIEKALDRYRQSYYDKAITEEQIDVITDPTKYLENWRFFSDSKKCNAVHRFAISQDIIIAQLKTNRAKENRINSVIEKVDSLILSVEDSSLKRRLNGLKTTLVDSIESIY